MKTYQNVPVTLKGWKGLNTPLMIIMVNHGYMHSWKMHVKLLFKRVVFLYFNQPIKTYININSELHLILIWWTHVSPPFSKKTSLSDDINNVWAPSRVITTPSWTSEKYNNFLGYTHHDNIHRLQIRKTALASPFNSHEWPRQNFPLQYQYNINEKSDENKEKYQAGGL